MTANIFPIGNKANHPNDGGDAFDHVVSKSEKQLFENRQKSSQKLHRAVNSVHNTSKKFFQPIEPSFREQIVAVTGVEPRPQRDVSILVQEIPYAAFLAWQERLAAEKERKAEQARHEKIVNATLRDVGVDTTVFEPIRGSAKHIMSVDFAPKMRDNVKKQTVRTRRSTRGG